MSDHITRLLAWVQDTVGPEAANLLAYLLNVVRWALTEGRPAVFLALMSLFLAGALVAIARKHLPEPDEAPIFHPLRSIAGRSKEIAIAALLLETGRTMDAVQAYRRILDLDPADPDALYNLGHAYFRLRLYTQARACWRAVRRLEPQAADARANLNLVGRLLRIEKPAGTGVLSGSGNPGSEPSPTCAG